MMPEQTILATPEGVQESVWETAAHTAHRYHDDVRVIQLTHGDKRVRKGVQMAVAPKTWLYGELPPHRVVAVYRLTKEEKLA